MIGYPGLSCRLAQSHTHRRAGVPPPLGVWAACQCQLYLKGPLLIIMMTAGPIKHTPEGRGPAPRAAAVNLLISHVTKKQKKKSKKWRRNVKEARRNSETKKDKP